MCYLTEAFREAGFWFNFIHACTKSGTYGDGQDTDEEMDDYSSLMSCG